VAQFTAAYSTPKGCYLSKLVNNATTVANAAASLPSDGSWTATQLAAAFNNTILVDVMQGSLTCAARVCRTLQLALNLASSNATTGGPEYKAARILLLNDVTLTVPAVLPSTTAYPTNLTFLLIVGAPNIDGSPRKLFVDSAAFGGNVSTYALKLNPAPASVLIVGLQALPSNAATAAALPAASVPGGVLQLSAPLLALAPKFAVHDVFVDTALELADAAVSMSCSTAASAATAGGCVGSIGAAYNVRLLGGAAAPPGAGAV
jgi:hypothetical protein